MTLLVLAAIFYANAALCFSMRRHQRLVFTRPLAPAVEQSLRASAYMALVFSAWVFIARDGGLVGMAAFTGWFTVFMIAMAGTVTFLSQRT
ncbi:MAG: DUF3325 domain-containing protein [Pseudomonadota bacterium]